MYSTAPMPPSPVPSRSSMACVTPTPADSSRKCFGVGGAGVCSTVGGSSGVGAAAGSGAAAGGGGWSSGAGGAGGGGGGCVGVGGGGGRGRGLGVGHCRRALRTRATSDATQDGDRQRGDADSP